MLTSVGGCVLQEWNMGQRAANTASVTFEDVVVPKEVRGVFVHTLQLLLISWLIDQLPSEELCLL